MEEQNNQAVDILEKLKSALLEKDKASAHKYVEEYEKLRPISDSILTEFCEVLFYFEEFEKAHKYFLKSPNPYGLARLYLHFGEYGKAIIEFGKWAKYKNEEGAENTFIMRILFAQHDFKKLIDFTESIMISLIASNNYRKESFINGTTDQILDALIISIINLYKCSTTNDFENILYENYPGISELISNKISTNIAFIRNIKKTSQEEINKLTSRITCYPNTSSKNLERTIDYLIDYEKYGGDFTIKIYENDPIMMRVKEQFTPYIEIKDAFTLFEKIVHDEINSKINYESKYQLDGLIDYYLLSKDYGIALKLLRTKKNEKRGVYGFVLLINLLLITNNDITASDLIDWQHLFFGKPLSKLVLSMKEDFIAFVDRKINEVKENEKRKFFDTLKEGLIYVPPYHPQNPPLLTAIGYTYRTIYESSPLYKSIMSKEIFPASIDLENGSACCQKYFKDVENEFRESLGIRFKEFGSDSEVAVYYFVKKLLPTHTIILQHSPDWLRPQRIDLFIKELNLAIEYQGEQHYRPIEYYGGEKTFKMLENNDKRKYELAKAMEVNLEYIRHDENIETRVNEIVKKYTEK